MKMDDNEAKKLAGINVFPMDMLSAMNLSEAALELVEMDDELKTLHAVAFDRLAESGNMANITNSIVWAYFTTACDIIKNKHPELDVYYEVNGMCSAFYIDGKQV